MKRKIVVLILILSLAISTTACSSESKKETSESPKKEETSESPKKKETSEPPKKEETSESPKKEEIPNGESTENAENDLIEQDISDNTDSNTNMILEFEDEDVSIEKEIQDYARRLITRNYTFTDIDEITVNENAGTEESGDYIILARLVWNQKNSGSMSKEILAMYSSDFAARVGSEQPSVNEVAIFWTVPYLNDANAKWAYTRNGEAMYLSDNMMDSIFNQ